MKDRFRKNVGRPMLPDKRRKAMGQHFLSSERICRDIAIAAAKDEKVRVLEIGPGRGILTEQLLALSEDVTAVELDAALFRNLELRYADNRSLTLVQGDFLKYDLPGWLDRESDLEPVVAANIPYSRTNDIVYSLLENHSKLRRAVLMVQDEVALKLAAEPGGKQYGLLTVMAQYRCRVEYLFQISRNYFSPPPEVDSAVVRFDFEMDELPVARDERLFFRMVRLLFKNRRKQIQKTLRNGRQPFVAGELLDEIQNAAGLELTCRPEEFSVSDLVRLADTISERTKS